VNGGSEDESWRQWLGRHGPALLLLARQHCHSAAHAQDAVQDGFLRFWKSRERAIDATAYAFACVRSAAIDLSRGRRRRDRHESQGVPPLIEVFEPAAGLEQEELRRAVEAALANLPAEQREVLVLKIWGGLTFAQIAAAVDVNPDTAASRYRYALGRLQTALRQEARHE
jgi:RNA polymerase sigma-70 factor (ECF subfamily)